MEAVYGRVKKTVNQTFADPCGKPLTSPRVPLMIRTFQDIRPTVPTSCFIEETAVVIGDVVMGEDCSVWFNAVIRGDVHYIRIGNRTNVQDLCMLHVTHDTHPLIIGNDVTIGHHVVLHGCTIHDRVLVGMGAIIMDGAVIGEDSVVGAGALVVEGTVVPPKSLILGSPAKVKRPVTEGELAWVRESAENYVKYARQYLSDSGKNAGFRL
jgi:carbonic anhydrase/acetyltransferase-like protein (isoleucine patch superfamily)